MATKQESIKIAVLETQMQEVNKKLDRIESTVEELPQKLIEVLDERYAKKVAVEELMETVEPFTKLRRNLWIWAITAVIAGGIAGEKAVDWIRGLIQ